uniref:CSN12-like protein n=1 Tax=Strigamia maritima TaxID=126957 RepID=T1J4S1_STRMM
MAHITINQYLTSVNTNSNKLDDFLQFINDRITEKDGIGAAELLSFKHPHIANGRLQIERPEQVVERIIEPPFEEVIAAHLRCAWSISNHDFIEAYRCQAIVVQSFTKIFASQKDENWALPIMSAVCLDLRQFAISADIQLGRKGTGKSGDTLEKAAELLMGCFRVCAGDNRSSIEDTKRWGMLNLVNQLFKIYFKINKLHLCKPLIRAIDSSNIKDQFSISQLVTYRYYVGRKAMFDSDFKNADEYLTYALQRCHRDCKNNKRLILIYLIPVKMLLGAMPAMGLLHKYDLLQFSEVIKAVKDGNLLLLNEAMVKNEHFFIKCGIYLILEKLKIITYRNLFKKVYLLLRTHQVPLEAFLRALEYLKVEDIDIDEVECIVANLIFENL